MGFIFEKVAHEHEEKFQSPKISSLVIPGIPINEFWVIDSSRNIYLRPISRFSYPDFDPREVFVMHWEEEDIFFIVEEHLYLNEVFYDTVKELNYLKCLNFKVKVFYQIPATKLASIKSIYHDFHAAYTIRQQHKLKKESPHIVVTIMEFSQDPYQK